MECIYNKTFCSAVCIPRSVNTRSWSDFPDMLYWPCRISKRCLTAFDLTFSTASLYLLSSLPPFDGLIRLAGSLLWTKLPRIHHLLIFQNKATTENYYFVTSHTCCNSIKYSHLHSTEPMLLYTQNQICQVREWFLVCCPQHMISICTTCHKKLSTSRHNSINIYGTQFSHMSHFGR
jgi:hypothetical protein